MKTWEENFEELQGFAKTKGHVYLPFDKPEYDALKEWLQKQVTDKDYLPKEHYDKLNALGIDWKTQSVRTGKWLEMFGKLQEFKQVFGHCRVPQNWAEDVRLSNWVCVQRRANASGKLGPDRKKKLRALGFVFSFKDIYEEQWEYFYEQLLKFKAQSGDCIVPGKFRKLAGWVDRQRTCKNKGVMPKDREAKLNSIGFIWNFDEINEKIWRENYGQLINFRKKYGHCLVSKNDKRNKDLGNWVATQRELDVRGKLDAEKREKLNKLDFIWKKDIQRELYAGYENKWRANFKKLKAYYKQWGTCQVSVKADPSLQRWTSLQRSLYFQGKLSAGRISKLEKIDFPWNISKAYWQKMYGALKRFHTKFGHTKVPWGWPKNAKLAPWVHRMKANKTLLSLQEINLLDQLGFEWKLRKRTVVSWEKMFELLIRFKEKNGHTKVPVQYKENPKLGKWVSRMRYDKLNLSSERIHLLDSLQFDWGNKTIAA